jgi:hypothetical protein
MEDKKVILLIETEMSPSEDIYNKDLKEEAVDNIIKLKISMSWRFKNA